MQCIAFLDDNHYFYALYFLITDYSTQTLIIGTLLIPTVTPAWELQLLI